MAVRPPLVSPPDVLDQQARDAFAQAFGGAPAVVTAAPGRMNIVGEHTDYNEGFVLPAAIDRHVAIALRLRGDAKISIRSDRYPVPVEMSALPSSKQGNWADYLFGVALEINRRMGDGPGFEASLISDLPVGSGLSSSGALEVATAAGLLAARRIAMPPLEIALLCQAAENRFVGARTGIMDQFTALQARAGNAMLLDCRSYATAFVPLTDETLAWLLADTRVKHELASSAYNQRRAECEAAAAALGLRSLRDATEADLDRIQNVVARRRARHVVTENGRVLQAVETLRRHRTRELGAILYASHSSLRDDFEVSCRELDALVELAAQAPGVIGARMMGGGFGGCVLVLLEAGRLDHVEQHLARGYEKTFRHLPAFYRVQSVDGVMPERAA